MELVSMDSQEGYDGVRIKLGPEQILALGLIEDMELGKQFMIHAKVCVVEAEMEDGRPELELKVKAMGVKRDDESDGGEVKDAPSGKVAPGKIRSVMSYHS